MNLPNKLTTTRLVLVPLLVIIYLFPYSNFNINLPILYVFSTPLSLVDIISFVIFLVASVTDYLDGYLARKNNQVTTFGKFIDPIADKLIVNNALLLLTYSGEISVLVPIIMISRDTIVDAIRMVATSKNKVLSASYLGKAKTMTQMIAICILLLNNVIFNELSIPMGQIMIIIATIISIVSGVDYLVKNKEYIMESM